MKLNPETLAKATSRHPWWTIAAWVVLIVLMAFVSSALLGGVVTDDVEFTSRPESIRAQHMIEGVEKMGDAARYVKSVLDRHERLMGFGHRVYRAYDPRAAVLRDTCKRLGAPRYEVALDLEKAAIAELADRYPNRRMETNVDFWAAVLLDFADVPGEMMTPLFVCARTAGWSAHILEQKRTGRLIRPSSRYVGPGPRPLEDVAGFRTT